MSNEIQIYQKITDVPSYIEQSGKWIAKSGMFGCENEQQGTILAAYAVFRGQSIEEIDRCYHLIRGRLVMRARFMYAEFLRLGGKVKWLKLGDDGQEVSAIFTFGENSIELSYNIARAKKAGLVKPGGPWEKTPEKMLRARLLSDSTSLLCPQIFAGDDIEVESELMPVTAPPLKLSTPAPVPPVPESAASVPVVEAVAVVVEPQPAVPAREENSTTPPPSPAPQPAPAGELLPDDMVVRLEKAIGEHGVKAANWMLKEHWLLPGQTLANLTPKRANSILARTEGFLRAVNASQA